MGVFLRWLMHLAAIVFLVFAAFGWFKDVDVNWFYLGIACWCAAYLPDFAPPARSRRTE